jgi:hypothetical protein
VLNTHDALRRAVQPPLGMNEENESHSEMRAQRTVGFFVLPRAHWREIQGNPNCLLIFYCQNDVLA